MKNIALIIAFLCATPWALAQDINMTNGTFNQCSGTFYDSGGPGAPYANGESFVLTICDDGSGGILQLDFLAFTTETPNDVLTIYDGADTTAPVIGDYSGTNSPGIVRPSPSNPSGCLTFEFVSNEFFSSTGWEAVISCCQEITASFDGSTPPAVGGIIEADVDEIITFNGSAVFAGSDVGATYTWDFGDGTTDTGLTVMHAYTSPGIYPVTFVATDAMGCANQNRVELIADVEFDTAIGNPFVDAGPDVELDCALGEVCTDLTADFLEIGETTTYDVIPIPFDPPFLFNGLANSLNPDIDDAWSDVEGLPFDFCFFGNTETEFQVGSNGVIRFDVDPSDTGAASNDWSFIDDLPNNVDDALAEANIFTPGHDIDPSVSDSEEIGYEVLGEAPNRVLVVSYYEVPMFSGTCNDLLATQMAVLYETTNIIDIYILNKPSCPTWNSGSAVIGIQNNEGTEAFVPPGRNTSDSPWETEFEAWRFIPRGPSVTTITWLDESGTVVGDTATINVCPAGNETYTARVEYLNCNGEVVRVEDTVTVSSNATFSFDLGDDITTCEPGPITLDADSGVADVTYQWFLDGMAIPGATDPTYDATTSGTYSCEVTDGECFVQDTIVLMFFEDPVANTPTDLTVCDDDNDGFAEFMLTDADAEIIAGQPDTFVNYYLTLDDATAGDTSLALVSPYTNISNPQTIYARIENLGGCFDTVSFLLTVNNSPVLNDPIAVYELCDDDTADGITTFDLTSWLPEVSDETGLTCLFYLTEADANAGTDPIGSPGAFENTANPQLIWVRCDNGDGCFTVGSFELNVNENPNIAAPDSLAICDDNADELAEFDLTVRSSQILNGLPPSDYTVQFYEDLDLTLLIADPTAYTNLANPQLIYVVVTNNVTGCSSLVTLELQVLDGPVINDPDPYELCDDNNPGDGIEAFDLTSRDTEVTGGASGLQITYHESEADAQAGASPLASPYENTSNPQTVYVRAEDETTGCYSTTTLELIVLALPTATQPADVTACGDSDGSASFDLGPIASEAANGQSGVTVTFHETEADADAGDNALSSPYANSSNPQVLYIRIQDDATGCYSLTTVTLLVEFVPNMTPPANVEVCPGPGAIGLTNEFDLSSYSDQLGIDLTGLTLSYHTSSTDAEDGVNAIANPSSYTNSLAEETVYVRATSAAGCFSITSFDLSVIQCEIVIPQGISPNGDGMNDTFHIEGIELHPNFVLNIFDRRGLLVYTGNGSTQEWDGRAIEQSGSLLPVGTYFYTLQLNDNQNEAGTQQLYSGYVYLNY
ncbi:MAG: gliding motility-associated C-terminal domain-containing protein [Gilvibacter sp.]